MAPPKAASRSRGGGAEAVSRGGEEPLTHPVGMRVCVWAALAAAGTPPGGGQGLVVVECGWQGFESGFVPGGELEGRVAEAGTVDAEGGALSWDHEWKMGVHAVGGRLGVLFLWMILCFVAVVVVVVVVVVAIFACSCWCSYPCGWGPLFFSCWITSLLLLLLCCCCLLWRLLCRVAVIVVS